MPRTSRPGSKPSDFHIFSSLSVICLMLTEFEILQSLIRSEILVDGLDGEDLVWADFLGAIVEISKKILRKFARRRRNCFLGAQKFWEWKFEENRDENGKVKMKHRKRY